MSLVLGSDGLLLKELSSLLNALQEEIKVNHVLLDLNHGQINQHTSDLGGVCGELLNEFEDDSTNSLLVVGVHFVDCANDGYSNAVEVLSKGMGRLSNSSNGLAKVLVSHNWSRRLSLLLHWGHASPHDRLLGLLLIVSLVTVALVVSTTTTLV